MSRPTIKTGGIAAAFAVWLVVEHNSYNQLHGEDAALRQQIRQLSEATLRPAVTSIENTNDFEKGRREHSELQRLRAEVGLLREAVEKSQRDLAAAQSENSQFLTLSNALEKADWDLTRSNLMVMKYIGVASRIYAANNSSLLPTNFNQIQSDFDFPAGEGPNSFVFFDYGRPLPTSAPGYYFLACETQATHYPTGQWKRVYLLADGSVQIGTSEDGNFDSWEQQWIQQQAQEAGALGLQ